MKRLAFTPILLITLSVCNFLISQTNISLYKKNKVIKNTLIIKINEEYRSSCNKYDLKINELNNLFNDINTLSIEKLFPNHEKPAKAINAQGDLLADISLIYQIKYDSPSDIGKTLRVLNSSKYIEYAEPKYVPELLYDTNDPLTTSQYYLNKISAFQAWDICKGDSTIVIGIVDTGVDYTHMDLSDNISYNYNDPVDFIDNDNDGFTDNFRGWDFGENDSNPYADSSSHGTIVAGIATARTDNNLGISGVGFRTKFLPVKIMNNNKILNSPYEGIIYAADHGCDIINCSWGGAIPTKFGQDIINYATFNRNALVVAAAGNNSIYEILYPASYENVISVTGTDQNDIRWEGLCWSKFVGGSYNEFVDIAAPGMNIYSTTNGGGYMDPCFGTSFAAPIVAGCAAIVKAKYPDYTIAQIEQKLKVTADLIDTIPENTDFTNLIGTGRVNLYKALTDTLSPGIKFKNIEITDNNDNIFLPNDTLIITGEYINYLTKSSDNLLATITCDNLYIQILNGTNNIGILNNLSSFSNETNPIKIKIHQNIPDNQRVFLKITYTDTAYNKYQFIPIEINNSYVTVDTNNIVTDITSNGKIAHDWHSPLFGSGFTFKNNEELISEAGLLLGYANNRISNCIGNDNDFVSINRAGRVFPSINSDFDVKAYFNDENASNSKVNVEVIQNIYAWNNDHEKNFIITEYNIINKNEFEVDDFYAGLYIDWDIYDYLKNKSSYNSENNFSYTYCTLPNTVYAGIKHLNSESTFNYAFDITSNGGNGIDISNLFTDSEKYEALKSTRDEAGVDADTNDVSNLMSVGPFSMQPNDTITVAFAIMAGESLYSLENSAEAAQNIYDSLYIENGINDITTDNVSINVYPNPSIISNSIIDINLKQNCNLRISVIDVYGNNVKNITSNSYNTGSHKFNLQNNQLSSGIYFIRFEIDNKITTRKFIITE